MGALFIMGSFGANIYRGGGADFLAKGQKITRGLKLWRWRRIIDILTFRQILNEGRG